MGRKSIIKSYKLDAAKSFAGSFTSSEVDVQGVDCFTFNYVWSGATSPTGNFKVQGTVDGTTWFDLTTTLAAGAGAAGSLAQMVSATVYTATTLQLLNVKKVRADYARTSGSGSCDIWIFGKVIGA
jgi:hypothetical protein